MIDEISAAVLFLTRLIGKNEKLNQIQIEDFKTTLSTLLVQRFKNHWFPEKPFKGQGYRCIRVNEMNRKDPVLEKAAQECGLKYEDLQLPVELTVWVDPTEVCCRFGEHKGSYCTVASFKEGDKENFVDNININELKKHSDERSKQDKWIAKKSPSKDRSSTNTPTYRNPLNQQQQQQAAATQQQQVYFHQPTFQQPHQAYSHYGSSPPSYIFIPSPVSTSSITSSTFSSTMTPYGKMHIPGSRVTSHRTNFATFPHILQQQQIILPNDRFHWVNKTVVKV